MKKTLTILSLVLITLSCSTSRVPLDEVPEQISSNPGGAGPELEILMQRGEAHNHPLMAIWAETPEGEFVQTLYVAESIGKGTFRHGDASEGFWKPGPIQRPAALPHWSHARGIQNSQGFFLPTPDSPVPDAYTGPTPGTSFLLQTRLDRDPRGPLVIKFEINQTWDWNEFWTNNKFPDDEEYKSSCQPALVYAATLDPSDGDGEIDFEILGRSHYNGSSGELYHDLETMSTALHIVNHISLHMVEDDAP